MIQKIKTGLEKVYLQGCCLRLSFAGDEADTYFNRGILLG
jgi:hypothetical protein